VCPKKTDRQTLEVNTRVPQADRQTKWARERAHTCARNEHMGRERTHVVPYLVKVDLTWVGTAFIGSSPHSAFVLKPVTDMTKSKSSRVRQ
jgi:hypothetical protein